MALFFPRRRQQDSKGTTGSPASDDGPIHVLAVTPGGWFNDLLDRLSRRYGIVSDRAADGDGALALTQMHQYNVVVVAKVARLDTAQLCRWLRLHAVLSPILIVAEDSSVADVVTSLDAGADGYLVGPIDDAELVARLQAVRWRYRHDLAQGTRPHTTPAGELRDLRSAGRPA